MQLAPDPLPDDLGIRHVLPLPTFTVLEPAKFSHAPPLVIWKIWFSNAVLGWLY
jgi:hypothetical protein